MRILWSSDRMYGGNSAYSKVTRDTLPRLVKAGHAVAHIPMGHAYNLGEKVAEGGILLYNSGNNMFNEDVMVDRYVHFRADLLIVLKETWVLSDIYNHSVNFVPYCPIDHSPVSPYMTTKMHTAFRVLTPSRFGQRELTQGEVENVVYMPHGVPSNVFRPLNKKKECKKLWFLPEDDFTVLFVGRNQSRKMLPRLLQVYKRFLELNPDVKSHLFLWTDVTPKADLPGEGAVSMGISDVGVNLLPEIRDLNLLTPVRWPDSKTVSYGVPDWAGENYVSGHDMVKLYNAADLLISIGGEGYYMPGMEAQACGVPFMTVDYASAPEICAAGLVVPYNDYIIMNSPGTRYPLIDIDKAAEALTKMMNANPEKVARKVRSFAEKFDSDKVIEQYWAPFLQEAENELYPLFTKEGQKTWKKTW